jgi:hypothetical protein
MKLNISSQPGSECDGIEFYKDEGGKGNWMSLQVSLNNKKNKTSLKGGRTSPSRRNDQIELRTELYFESGLPVEASDQKILLVRLHGKSSSSLSSLELETINEKKNNNNPKPTAVVVTDFRSKLLLSKATLNSGVTIEFRIQKVSRRKDNQRFKVQLSTSDPTIQPIYTRPITVLSKRKIPARLRNDPEAIALYKAEKLNRAQMNRAASKRKRSNEATPELRPLSAGSKMASTNSTTSKKRARSSSNNSNNSNNVGYNNVELRTKIDQMSHTINQLYDMMQDQRIQIDQLQEQVRVLNDSNMHLGFAALDGAFEDDVLHNTNHHRSSSTSSSSGSSSSLSLSSSLLSTSTMLTGLDMLSSSSDDISTTFDDSTEKAMAEDMQKKEPLQWNFCAPTSHVEMPPLPVLNL